MLGQWVADGADRRHFGHAPGVHDAGVEVTFEAFDDSAWGGRASDHHTIEAELLARLYAGAFDMLLEHHPDSWHAERHGHAFIAHQLIDAGAIQGWPGQDQLGTR
ncbi:hypothetical protein FQZ97_1084910 [compost metagenome]